jgi:serine/threonine protein kinase
MNSRKQIIGDYELLDLVGEGAFSKVFRAEHRTTHKVFAIK